MKPSKKPPPDTRGNVLGRISQLHQVARANARGGIRVQLEGINSKAKSKNLTQDRKAPKDYDKRLEAALKVLEPKLTSLERRLKRCPAALPASKTTKPKRPQTAKPKRPQTAKPKRPQTAKPKRPQTAASSVLHGESGQEPLSRESALTQAVTKPGGDILDFMQGTLDE